MKTCSQTFLACSAIILTCSLTVGSELTVTESAELIEQAGNKTQRQHLELWRTQTSQRTWKSHTGKHTTMAGYVSSTDSEVVLRKDNGSTINVPLDKLDFNSRVRIQKIRDIEHQLIGHGSSIKSEMDLIEEERKRRKLEETKRAMHEASLTKEQRQIRSDAIELSDAGMAREEAIVLAIIGTPGDDLENLALLSNKQAAMDMFKELVSLYKDGTLSEDSVKNVLKEHAGGTVQMRIIEGLFFGDANENVALILVEDYPLVTRLDVYYSAGRTLHPKVRSTYGFNFVETFERLGDKTYWEYMHDERLSKK